MKKRVIIVLMGLILIATILATSYNSIPNPGHGADDVFVFINGDQVGLQEAIYEGLFEDCSVSGGDYSGNIVHGHDGSEIIVNVNGITKTLQQAINDKSFLSSANKGTSPAAYSTTLGKYNTADQISVIVGGVEKTLQQAINAGDFICVPAEPEPPAPTEECRFEYSTVSSDSSAYAVSCVTGDVYGPFWTVLFRWNGASVGDYLYGQGNYNTYCSAGTAESSHRVIGNYEYWSNGTRIQTGQCHVSNCGYVKEICRKPIN